MRKQVSPITKEELKELKKVGALLEKKWKAYRESEEKLGKVMLPILTRLEENKDKMSLLSLIEHIPNCSRNGQFIYSTIYRLDNPK